MPEPIPLHARQPRGPAHPPPPPPPTDPRLQLFPLLPGEDGAAWSRHAGEVLDGLGPLDGLERKLAAAVAVGMWRECRADRIEAEVLTDIAPHDEGRGHGSDLQEPAHVAALTAALRCQTAASIATGRALRLFLAQRKARATGLLSPADTDTDPDVDTDGDALRTCEPNGRPRTREPEP
ncbi:MAG: hypothetical protein WAS21_21275, partial [Geminicoccaceae bacterium]